MEKNEFLDKLNTLVANEDVLSVSREVSELKSSFEDFVLEEERQNQIAYLEAQERGENVTYEEPSSVIKDEFYKIYGEYKVKKDELLKKRKEERARNYAQKSALLAQLKKLIEEEENIKSSYDVSKEIHEKWKEIGEVEREKDNELQSEYSRLRDAFFTNLKIFKELRDYDLKKNLEEKEEIIKLVEALKQEEDVKKAEIALKLYRNQFDETGPVPNEGWERIRDSFWGAVREVYALIHQYYEGRKEELKANIDKKSQLLEEVKNFISEKTQSIDNPKKWDDATKELINFQEKWKSIGFGLKKENEELWKSFREQCNLFFERKKSFYQALKSDFDENAKLKKDLIQKVKDLKDSTDWKETTAKIIGYQKQWKSIKHAGNRSEQVLWKEFRGACDDFFNAKDEFFKERNNEEATNLEAKLAVVEKVKSYNTPENKEQLMADMKEFSREFSLIGRVPFKEKDKVYNAFKEAVNKHYESLNVNEQEKNALLFQAEVANLKAAPNADRLLDDKKQAVRNEMKKVKDEIIQYENNMSFFSGNKEKNPLFQQAEKRLNDLKGKMDKFKHQLKLLNE